jgi:hypothetical protein
MKEPSEIFYLGTSGDYMAAYIGQDSSDCELKLCSPYLLFIGYQKSIFLENMPFYFLVSE